MVLSDSPVKLDKDSWVSSLDLYSRDRVILQTAGSWVNDNIISAAHRLLKQQSEDKIEGFQCTQLAKKLAFAKIKPFTQFVQILHVDGNHWNVLSNIRGHDGGIMSDSVFIFDSLYNHVSLHTKKQICSLIRPRCKEFRFDIVDTQRQTNASDCGIFAIAFATELIHHKSPALCEFDVSQMRPHLIKCLEGGALSRFPLKKVRRVPMGRMVRKSIKENIYCSCRMPNDKNIAMIYCDRCTEWFHHACEGLPQGVNVDDREGWMCSTCRQLLQ